MGLRWDLYDGALLQAMGASDLPSSSRVAGGILRVLFKPAFERSVCITIFGGGLPHVESIIALPDHELRALSAAGLAKAGEQPTSVMSARRVEAWVPPAAFAAHLAVVAETDPVSLDDAHHTDGRDGIEIRTTFVDSDGVRSSRARLFSADDHPCHHALCRSVLDLAVASLNDSELDAAIAKVRRYGWLEES